MGGNKVINMPEPSPEDKAKMEAEREMVKQMMDAKREHIKKDAKTFMVIPLTPELKEKFDYLVEGLEMMTGEKVELDFLAYEVFEMGLQDYIVNLQRTLFRIMQEQGL